MWSKINAVIWGFKWDEMNRFEARKRHYSRGTCMTVDACGDCNLKPVQRNGKAKPLVDFKRSDVALLQLQTYTLVSCVQKSIATEALQEYNCEVKSTSCDSRDIMQDF